MCIVIVTSRSRTANSGSLGGIVCLTVSNVLVVAFSAGMVLFVAGVDEPFVSDEEVAPGKGLGTDVANERLLFGVGTNVSLEMLLQAMLAFCWRRRTAEGFCKGGTHESCEEALTVRAGQCLGLAA